jgi:hypothetical protein
MRNEITMSLGVLPAEAEQLKKEQGSQPKFRASWGSSYVEPGSKEVSLGFFTEDLGYTDEDRLAVANLGLRQIVALDAGDHEVKRIE